MAKTWAVEGFAFLEYQVLRNFNNSVFENVPRVRKAIFFQIWSAKSVKIQLFEKKRFLLKGQYTSFPIKETVIKKLDALQRTSSSKKYRSWPTPCLNRLRPVG